MKQVPTVTRCGALDAQVCVPKEWTDEQAVALCESLYPCGTTGGWHIRKEGDKALNGSPERVECAGSSEFVHIMLDA